MVWTQSMSVLSLPLPSPPPSLSPCVAAHLLPGSRPYIMQTLLSIIYLHMYHSCFQPSIIHQLLEASFEVPHFATGVKAVKPAFPSQENKDTKAT